MVGISEHTFIDGVGDIRLHEGLIRMDLLALSTTRRDPEGNPFPEFTGQVVMSPPAFLRMVGALANTVRQMQEQGLLGAGDGAGAESSSAEPVSRSRRRIVIGRAAPSATRLSSV